jgi:hypothetical protein
MKAAVATARGQHGDSGGFSAAISGSTAGAAQQKGGGNGTAAAGRWRWAARQQGSGDSAAAAMQWRHDCPKDRWRGSALLLPPLLAMPP